MKYEVLVTVQICVEVDDTDIKAEFGKATEKMILQQAINVATLNKAFNTTAVVVNKYQEQKRSVRRGIGSY